MENTVSASLITMPNNYFKLWLPIIAVHALHQLEESISFFQWYIDHAANIPAGLQILSTENANRAVQHPGYFIAASIVLVIIAVLLALLFRHRVKTTRVLLTVYIAGLMFFFVWHILTSYVAHSYAPVLITCFIGLYLAPGWLMKLYKKQAVEK
jgi:hypothetical protein